MYLGDVCLMDTELSSHFHKHIFTVSFIMHLWLAGSTLAPSGVNFYTESKLPGYSFLPCTLDFFFFHSEASGLYLF